MTSPYSARREVLARYLAREYEQPIQFARLHASELMAIVQTWIDELCTRDHRWGQDATSDNWMCLNCGKEWTGDEEPYA